MQNFFNPAEQSETLIPMYGTVHMLTLLALIIFILVMIWNTKAIKKLANNRRFIRRLLVAYIGIDMLYWALIWGFRVEPFFERFPLHLCATLSIVLPVLILFQKYKWVRFISYWSVCAGFISFVNPSFVHDAPWSFAFIHYMIRHYFLFLIPIFLQIGMGFKHRYRDFLFSTGTLIVYAFIIFLLDWATGANYMHLGQHNPLEIPFLPVAFAVWPWTYPSFVIVGLILFHITFIGLKLLEKHDRLVPVS